MPTNLHIHPRGGDDIPDNLSGLLGSLDKLVFVLDERAIFTAASEPLIHLLGIPGSALIGRAANDIFIGAGSLIAGGTRASAVPLRQ